MKLRLTLRALGDIEDISDYIRSRDPNAAQRVRNELQRALLAITAHPRAGRLFADGRRRFALRRFPYLIFYRVDESAEEVRILTIRHAARREEQ